MRKITSFFVLMILMLAVMGQPGVQAEEDNTGFFVHTVSAANLLTSTASVITHPWTDNNPSAILYVTQNATPVGHASSLTNAIVGVRYDGNIGKWLLISLGANPLNTDSTFNILVEPDDAENQVYTVPAGFNTGQSVLDYPALNSNPEAIIVATHQAGEDNGLLVINNHPTGLFYNEDSQKWVIENQDGVGIPGKSLFNLHYVPVKDERNFAVMGFEGTMTNGNKSIVIGSPLLDGKPGAMFWVTPENSIVANESGMNKAYYLEYNDSLDKWQVTTMGTSLVGVIFHVYIPPVSQINANVLLNSSFENAAPESNRLADDWKAKNLLKDRRKCSNAAKQKYVSYIGDCAFQLIGVSGRSSSIEQKASIPTTGAVKLIALTAAISGKNLTDGVSIQAVIKRPNGDKGKLIIDPADIHNGTYTYKSVSDGFNFAPDFNTAKVKVSMNDGAGKLMIDEVRLQVVFLASSDLIPLPVQH